METKYKFNFSCLQTKHCATPLLFIHKTNITILGNRNRITAFLKKIQTDVLESVQPRSFEALLELISLNLKVSYLFTKRRKLEAILFSLFQKNS